MIQKNHSQYKFKEVFSFYHGFLSFFGLKERHIDELRKIINSRSDSDAIKEDFNNIGNDIRTAMKKLDPKVSELHLCD